MEVIMHGYVGGYYRVMAFAKNDKYLLSKYFDNEQEARDFGNKLWKQKHVYEIDISKTGFYKKRRNSITIATACKGDK